MIRSEIQQLDNLITSLPKAANDSAAKTYLEAIKVQCQSVKQQWLRKLFSSVSDTILVRYVHYHQAGVIALSDRVWRWRSSIDHKEVFIKSVLSNLEDLIDFLKDSFYRYFDKRHPISLARWQTISNDIREQLKSTLAALQQGNVEAELISAIKQAITQKLQDDGSHSLSFQQAYSILCILRKLSELAAQAKEPVTPEIAQELHRHNFNSYQFNLWYQEFLIGELQHFAEHEKTAFINRMVRQMESLYPDADKTFDPDLPNSNEQALRWLRKLAPATADQPTGVPKAAPERLPLFYSVPQFAFFVRLCYLEGCFPAQNVSAIFRFFTSHFETKKQPNVSVKSFGRAFYSTDQATAAIVRDLLQRMINFINKTYFPK